ncbi:hypothetical protein BDL97_02G169700 [Sphagnum fallax]|nr:hypothetical protein BDL97_02G169700 [Sphagnum fallax]
MYATLTRTKSGISSSAALLMCLGFGSAMAIGNRLLQKTKNCLWKDANTKRHSDVDIWLQLSGGTGITPHAVQIQCHSFESQQLYTDSTSLCQCHMRISVAKRNLMLWHMPTKHQGTLAIKGPLVNGSNQ